MLPRVPDLESCLTGLFTCSIRPTPREVPGTRQGMLKITGLFTLAAVLYGLVHDQITARVCVEYFTIAHEPLVASTSPTVLGLVWGVVATWWAGTTAGLVVALAAWEGPWPKLSWRYFVQPALTLAALMGVAALLAGIAGYVMTTRGIIHIVTDYQNLIAPERQARFMADVWAHLASYSAGLLGSAAIAMWARRTRRQLARAGRVPQSG
jgi:hypothetical protein